MFDFRAHLEHQSEWSEKTFGPGPRHQGVVDHIRKELKEIEAAPGDLEEWIDVVILALDGAWRTGASPDRIISMMKYKQAKNELRDWPDWRTAPPDKAIEHSKEKYIVPDGVVGVSYSGMMSYVIPDNMEYYIANQDGPADNRTFPTYIEAWDTMIEENRRVGTPLDTCIMSRVKEIK